MRDSLEFGARYIREIHEVSMDGFAWVILADVVLDARIPPLLPPQTGTADGLWRHHRTRRIPCGPKGVELR